MRIGVSTSVIQRGKTGIAQHVFALLRAFLDLNAEPRFFLFVLEEDRALFDFAEGRMEIVTVSERFRSPVENIVWHQTQLPKLARGLKLDVLHVPSYRRLLWPRPCPLVATIHDLAPFRVPRKYDWLRMVYGRVLVRRLAQRQDRIIAVSAHTAADIRTFFAVPPERVKVIPNGIEHERFYPGCRDEAKAWVARRYRLSEPFFLYVARLEHPAKNHLRLIAAFDEFKAKTGSIWKLVLGGSDWHGAQVIHESIRRSPFHDDIQCLGFVPDADLPQLYRAADVFVYPSLFEGFGMPPSEAMACGCPVISSNRGALAEVIGGAALVINPENVEELAKALRDLACDPERREQLSHFGLDRSTCFTWKKAAAETIEIYRQAGRIPIAHVAA